MATTSPFLLLRFAVAVRVGSHEHRRAVDVRDGFRATWISVIANPIFAATKIVAGVVGNSYALIADGIESCADVFSSFVVWKALRVSTLPADANHPYGHGKIESFAAVFVAMGMLGAAVVVAVQSVREIVTPHHAPAPFTLGVLVVIVIAKELIYRRMRRAADALQSGSLRGDAWHHRSDAITSAAAFVGIVVAIAGGPGFEAADDWAALLACVLIAHNGLRLLRPAIDELMDAAVPASVVDAVRATAGRVPGVRAIEKVRVRKSGLMLLMDIHVVVDGEASVREGHTIGHRVKDALITCELPVLDVVVHVEPDGDGLEEKPR